MPPWRFPGWRALVRVSARGLGWLTALMAIIVVGFVVQQWPDAGGSAAPGLLGESPSLAASTTTA